MKESYDVCVVLGGGFEHDNPSIYTMSRLLKGIDLVRKKYANFLMLAGSKDELKVMYNVAVKSSIESNKIIICHPSKTTIGNAYYAKKEAMKHGFKKIIVVTSSFHIERALAIFDSVFGNEYVIAGQQSDEDAEAKIIEREKKLKVFLPLLKMFRKGDHEKIMLMARLLGIEEEE